MKRINCFVCKGLATFQLETWPSLYICWTCAREWVSWLHVNHLVVGNPVAKEFVLGFADVESPQVRFFVRSSYDDNAWAEAIYWLDSNGNLTEKNPSTFDPLDILK